MKEKVEMKAKVCEDQRKLIDAIIQQKHHFERKLKLVHRMRCLRKLLSHGRS
jgi:hypothetical protein